MVIFTILMSILAPASPVPNPNCSLIYRHDAYTRELVERVLVNALRDQKDGPCTGQTLNLEEPLARCAPLALRDVERINRRLALQGLPRDATLDFEQLNARAGETTLAQLVTEMMADWDKLYCKDGQYR